MTIRKTTLANGIRVASYKVDTFSANIGVFVGTGSRNEEDHEHGLSHFLEHMAFKGTLNRSGKDIAKAIELRGGSTNAFTSKAMTAYYARVLPKDIELALDILVDNVCNSTYNENDIEIERGVIKQELKMFEDNARNIAINNLEDAVYKNQRYGKNIIGTLESLDTFNKQHFIDYTSKWYVPNNMIMVATGNVDHEEIVKLVEKYTAHLTTSPISSHEHTSYVGGHSIFNKSFEQVSFYFGFPCVGYGNVQDNLTIGMLSDYLGDGMSSPLFEEVRDNRGLVYGIGSGVTAIKETGLLIIGGGSTANNINEIIDVSLDVMQSVITNFEEDHFTRAKNQNMMQIASMQESPSSLMRYLGGNWMMGEEFLFDFDDVMKKLDNITKEHIIAATEEILSDPVKISISLVGPVEDSTMHKVEDLTKQ